MMWGDVGRIESKKVICQHDHVHGLICMQPKYSISQGMRYIKGRSRMMRLLATLLLVCPWVLATHLAQAEVLINGLHSDGNSAASNTDETREVVAPTGEDVGYRISDTDPAPRPDSGSYYARVNTGSPSQLRCSLHATIKDHTAYPYSSRLGIDTWTILEIADEDPTNSDRILDAYRNRSYAKVSERVGRGQGLVYNREHTWPNSLGFASAIGDKGLPNAPYTDTHMLYLTDAIWNADRGNKPYATCDSNCGERSTEANNGHGGGSGHPGSSNWVRAPDGNGGSFEVWNHRKGDMARAVMYMAIRYEGGEDATTGQSEPDLELTDDRSKIVRTSASPAYMGLLSTLIDWHQADPPDAAERARNEVIFRFQGNRNPFIDHPEWATPALFTSAKPVNCQLRPTEHRPAASR